MSAITDFNRIEECDKIDSRCIDAYTDFYLDPDNPTGLCLHTPWGGDCLDLTSIVKAAETCTTLYLSPDDNPNCLVYEPEEKCGDNICIHGDDLSRIISMTKLKDVAQTPAISDGNVYMFDSATGKFVPYDLKTTINNINVAIQNLTAAVNNLTTRVGRLEDDVADIKQTLANHETRLGVIEEKLTPPADAPSNVRVVFGNINDYSDPNVVINEGSGTVTSLDKTHGLYAHTLASNAYGDEIFG